MKKIAAASFFAVIGGAIGYPVGLIIYLSLPGVYFSSDPYPDRLLEIFFIVSMLVCASLAVFIYLKLSKSKPKAK